MGIFGNLFGTNRKNVKGTITIGGGTHKVEATIHSSDASIKAEGTVESNGKREPFNASFTEVPKEKAEPVKQKEAPVRQAGFSEEAFTNEKKLQNYFH